MHIYMHVLYLCMRNSPPSCVLCLLGGQVIESKRMKALWLGSNLKRCRALEPNPHCWLIAVWHCCVQSVCWVQLSVKLICNAYIFYSRFFLKLQRGSNIWKFCIITFFPLFSLKQYSISTKQQSFLVLTVICTDPSSRPLGSSGECTLTVQQKLADWTGNFLFDSACLFSWTQLTCADLSSQVQRSSARAPLCTDSNKMYSVDLQYTWKCYMNAQFLWYNEAMSMDYHLKKIWWLHKLHCQEMLKIKVHFSQFCPFNQCN